MSSLNIQSWFQARKYCRLRLNPAARQEICAVLPAECYCSTKHIGTRGIRRWFRATALRSFKVSYRDVYTLNPANFHKAGQEWIDISSVSHPTLRVFASAPSGVRESKPIQLSYAMKPPDEDTDSDGRRSPRRELFPPDSKGFLYYYSPPSRPRIAGELRLRVTPTNDPSTFQQGKDLCFLDPNLSSTTGHPWKRPLYSIVITASLRPLYEKLIEDGLISPELVESINSLSKLKFMYSRAQIIHALYDTFTIDLSSDWTTLVAVAEGGLATIHLLRQFRDNRVGMTPYMGTVLARFEPSSLAQHKNTRTVVLRILEELTPVRCLISSYDEYIEPPTPGNLYAKRFHGKLRPWSVNLDSPDKGKLATVGLKLMWASTPGLDSSR